MARSEREATVLIVDVGVNTDLESNDKTFFERAKKCASKIIERKIFSKPNDEIGLIAMGTNTTSNQLNSSIGGYDYISVLVELALSNWNMIRTLENEITLSTKVADWLDALIVAMDFLRQSTLVKKFTRQKIILFTTFSNAVDEENIETVIEGLKKMNIEFIVISDNVEYLTNEETEDEAAIFSQKATKSQVQVKSEEMIKKIIDETDGLLCNFDNAIMQMTYMQKKVIRPTSWNAVLRIGPNIEINVSSYIYIEEDKSLGSWKTSSIYPDMQIKTNTEQFVNDNKVNIEKKELISGYYYGTTVVPYNVNTTTYQSGPRGLTCIGFTSSDSILEEYLCDSGTNIIIADKKFPTSFKLLKALVDSMIATKRCMIARRVYNFNNKPKIMALIPNYKLKYPCLTMLELIYENNVVYMPFPSLKKQKYKPTEEQLNAVDDLIDNLDLMKAYEPDDKIGSSEAYKKFFNPVKENIYRSIKHRVLYPTEPLPKPDQELLDIMDIPSNLKVKAKPSFEDIKKLFPIEEIRKTATDKLFHKYQIDLQSADEKPDGFSLINDAEDNYRRKFYEVGTLNPAEDFLELLQRGSKLSDLAKQIQNIIYDLVFKLNVKQEEKIITSMVTFRDTCKELGAYHYNNWIRDFKVILLQRQKHDVWQTIVENNLGLISMEESDTSTITVKEAQEFNLVELKVNKSTVGEEDNNDVDALLDSMLE